MARKQFKTDNIVIVCEGNETEYMYFNYFRQKFSHRFSDFKVIASTEVIKRISDENKKLKKLAKKSGDAYIPTYITLRESGDNANENYKEYRRAPAKYAREAYLWKRDKKYSEVWVVYDLDDTDDKDHEVHEKARSLIERESLHKAFSAYSFEEWLLLYDERCAVPFDNSTFDEASDEDAASECEGRNCKHKRNTCHVGCIGGYMEERGYAKKYSETEESSYSKKDGKKYAERIYVDAILRHKAYVNAAWSRSLCNDVFYNCNPYTDVDKLVMRLMGESIDIHWVHQDEWFGIDNHNLSITKASDATLYLKHEGRERCCLTNEQIYWCDADYQKSAEAIMDQNIEFMDSDNSPKPILQNDIYKVLCIKSVNQEIYINFE